MATNPNEGGVLKADILMLALGEEGASQVMKHVSPRDVQKLSAVMTTLRRVEQATVAETLRDFLAMLVRAHLSILIPIRLPVMF